MKTEVETLKIFNPFSGEDEELICTLELHSIKKSIVADLVKVVSEQGDNIIEWLNEEKVEEYERSVAEAYNG